MPQASNLEAYNIQFYTFCRFLRSLHKSAERCTPLHKSAEIKKSAERCTPLCRNLQIYAQRNLQISAERVSQHKVRVNLQKLHIYPYLVLQHISAQGKGKSEIYADLPLPCAVCTPLCRNLIFLQKGVPFCRFLQKSKISA
jgi:hypothetical protein